MSGCLWGYWIVVIVGLLSDGRMEVEIRKPDALSPLISSRGEFSEGNEDKGSAFASRGREKPSTSVFITQLPKQFTTTAATGV